MSSFGAKGAANSLWHEMAHVVAYCQTFLEKYSYNVQKQNESVPFYFLTLKFVGVAYGHQAQNYHCDICNKQNIYFFI
ncbi:MAG: hypothetical protein C6P36_15310 [Geobacillus sp.]|nr:MAG: hypothetical protein C6P36_15310 [Geobacillus sp.]